MAEVKPVVKGREITDQIVADHMDRAIGLYFDNTENREKYTLGEYLVWYYKNVLPIPLMDQLHKRI